MNGTYTSAERQHVQRVKSQPCSVCHEPAPSEAHHIDQGDHWTVIALCEPCHRGPHGWHGDRQRWKLRKLFTEPAALNVTLQGLLA